MTDHNDDLAARLQATASQQAEQPKRRKRWPFIAAAALVVLGGGAIALGLMSGHAAATEESLSADLWVTCSIANHEIMDGEIAKDIDAGKMDPSAGLVLCGIILDRVDGGWTFMMVPNEYDDGISLSQSIILGQFGDKTGCYKDIDLDKMGSTRALDGRVESANGRSSWTYHPDDGLNIVCED